jgi:hypothetical protein
LAAQRQSETENEWHCRPERSKSERCHFVPLSNKPLTQRTNTYCFLWCSLEARWIKSLRFIHIRHWTSSSKDVAGTNSTPHRGGNGSGGKDKGK